MTSPDTLRTAYGNEIRELTQELRDIPGCDCDECIRGCHIRELHGRAIEALAQLQADLVAAREEREHFRERAGDLFGQLMLAEKAAAALRSSPQGGDQDAWRPISSVPLGEEVLVFGGRRPLSKTAHGRSVGIVHDRDELYRDDGTLRPSAPTHWSPLPAPPLPDHQSQNTGGKDAVR
jgi:hypothetical protein